MVITNRKVNVIFAEPYATIEKLVNLAKIGISEFGYENFKQKIISSCDKNSANTKKEPEGSDLNCSVCFKWWRLGDCLDLFALNVTSDFASRNFRSFCKNPPHSAHRSFELLKCAFAH